MHLPLSPQEYLHAASAASEMADLRCSNDDLSVVPVASEVVFRHFRDALSRFPTGVTVITALTPDGTAIGVTISSFNSVSLEPPLILWSLSSTSPNLAAFAQVSHYAVNVLAADQSRISESFAAREEDRFNGVRVRPGLGGVPLVEGCSAWFECSHEAQYPGGDHLILVGRVHRFTLGDASEPLIFHGGRYRELRAETDR